MNSGQPVEPRRRYDASKRRAAARETRERVIRSAARCFEEQGFAATTVTRIADRAEVSPETVYAMFGSKRALLQAWIDRSVAGDDLDEALRDRWPRIGTWSQLSAEERDAALREQLSMLRALNARVATPLRVLRSAADAEPALTAVVAENEHRRRRDLEAIVGDTLGGSAPTDRLDRLVDAVAVLTSDEVYTALVIDRGWNPEEYETLLAVLLVPVLDGAVWPESRLVPGNFGNLSSRHALHPMESQPLDHRDDQDDRNRT